MPSFTNISNLHSYSIKDQLYFFDANVWIFALDYFTSNNPGYKEKYRDIFYEVIDNPKNKAKAVVCSLLVSEVINTYMKRVALPLFIEEHHNGVQPENFDFKTDYRGHSTNHFKGYFDLIKDNVNAFLKDQKNVLIIDDGFNSHFAQGIVTDCPASFDFNDFYYYRLIKEISSSNKISVVTHDGDWKVKDIDIITAEKKLLNLVSYV